MKKIIVLSLVFIFVMSWIVILSACDNNEDSFDYFDGAISVKSYDTTEDAAEAFLQEYNGETENLMFESYTKTKDLSRQEIERLSLGSYSADDVEEAEEGEIAYKEMSLSRSADGEKNIYAKYIVLVCIGGKYNYCIYSPKTGEKLSKTYYDSVVNFDNYDSFLYKNNAVVKSNGQILQDIKSNGIYSKDCVYIETFEFGSISLENCYTFQPKDYNMLIIAQKNKDTSVWEIGENGAFWIVNSALIPFISTLDHSYYIKTDEGFKIDSEKTVAYIEKLSGGTNSSSQINNLEVNYKIDKNGIFVKINIDYIVDKGVRFVQIQELEYTNINNAVIDIPQELLEKVEEYKNSQKENWSH